MKKCTTKPIADTTGCLLEMVTIPAAMAKTPKTIKNINCKLTVSFNIFCTNDYVFKNKEKIRIFFNCFPRSEKYHFFSSLPKYLIPFVIQSGAGFFSK